MKLNFALKILRIKSKKKKEKIITQKYLKIRFNLALSTLQFIKNKKLNQKAVILLKKI